MILGAMGMHVPLIQRAKELGLYVITLDYLPENPGHKLADECYFDSTTDKDAVLKRAKECHIDGILTFVSDPAAETVAYVSEKLGIPGNSFKAVQNISEKDLFRKSLEELGLNFPKRYEKETCSSFPVIVKPVDSSGSKGVKVVFSPDELKFACENALNFSRCKRYIIEDFIEPSGPQLHGDGFVMNGKLVFLSLGDHHFDKNSLVPYSTSFPTVHSESDIKLVYEQVSLFIEKSGFVCGGINVEARISKKDGKAYLIDIGARNGGNFTPKLIEYYTGFNAMEAVIKNSLGEEVDLPESSPNGFYSYLVLHSQRDGKFSCIHYSDELKSHIIEEHLYVKKGDEIHAFTGANQALGVLIMKYKSMEDMNSIIDNFETLYSVSLDKKS